MRPAVHRSRSMRDTRPPHGLAPRHLASPAPSGRSGQRQLPHLNEQNIPAGAYSQPYITNGTYLPDLRAPRRPPSTVAVRRPTFVSTHRGSAEDARVVRVCADSCAKTDTRRPKLPAAARSELGSPTTQPSWPPALALAPAPAPTPPHEARRRKPLPLQSQWQTALSLTLSPRTGRGDRNADRTLARSFAIPGVRARTASQ
jgi:hypothetical protein